MLCLINFAPKYAERANKQTGSPRSDETPAADYLIHKTEIGRTHISVLLQIEKTLKTVEVVASWFCCDKLIFGNLLRLREDSVRQSQSPIIATLDAARKAAPAENKIQATQRAGKSSREYKAPNNAQVSILAWDIHQLSTKTPLIHGQTQQPAVFFVTQTTVRSQFRVLVSSQESVNCLRTTSKQTTQHARIHICSHLTQGCTGPSAPSSNDQTIPPPISKNIPAASAPRNQSWSSRALEQSRIAVLDARRIPAKAFDHFNENLTFLNFGCWKFGNSFSLESQSVAATFYLQSNRPFIHPVKAVVLQRPPIRQEREEDLGTGSRTREQNSRGRTRRKSPKNKKEGEIAEEETSRDKKRRRRRRRRKKKRHVFAYSMQTFKF
ncbi:hypothetical protein WN51_00565 [Melipona quadrifasciata]|uniref:Uncharacterized protein n=1 Tax=Melipona quadrifasciata TaxID=166423 RepID=A0A0M9A028_9HYME|nr:hypothetical protein WN51_00565 [Melipona quadrifasciata]